MTHEAHDLTIDSQTYIGNGQCQVELSWQDTDDDPDLPPVPYDVYLQVSIDNFATVLGGTHFSPGATPPQTSQTRFPFQPYPSGAPDGGTQAYFYRLQTSFIYLPPMYSNTVTLDVTSTLEPTKQAASNLRGECQ